MCYLQLSWINLYQNHFYQNDFVSKWPVSELPNLSVAVNQNLLRLRIFSNKLCLFFSRGSRFKVCFYFRWTSLWSYRGWHFVCFFSVSAALILQLMIILFVNTLLLKFNKFLWKFQQDNNICQYLFYCNRYGEIVNINLVRDKKTGKTKGFCFLCYEDQRSTVLAVDNFNGIKVGTFIFISGINEMILPFTQGHSWGRAKQAFFMPSVISSMQI